MGLHQEQVVGGVSGKVRPVMRRLLRIILILLASLGGLVAAVTIAPPCWYVKLLAGPWPEPRGAVLIVLGGDVMDNGMLGETSYLRSLFAVLTWRGGSFRQVVLSGDSGTTLPMRDFLVSQGVPASAILIEGRSTSTHENALNTAQFVRDIPGPYVLLTSDYHMWRAHRAFAKAGLAVTPAPFSDVRKLFSDPRWRWTGFVVLAGETVKIVYYWARGWV
jgi:uncharacterized SAM-binding protein YcdF (DUF218 family)